MQGFYCIYPPIYSTKSDRATYNFKGNSASHFVGYQTMPVTKSKYHAFAVQFKDVSKTDAEVAIQDLLTCSNPQGGTRVVTTVDHFHRWDGMGWIKYYYNTTLGGYVKDGESEITKDKLDAGEGVFFLRSSKGKAGDKLSFTKPAGL